MLATLESFRATAVFPEMVLAVSAMLLLMIGVFVNRRNVEIVNSLALLALALAALAVLSLPQGKIEAFGGAFIADRFAQIMKLLVLFGAAERSSCPSISCGWRRWRDSNIPFCFCSPPSA
jgi:NADH:ubiquinone oxidoreductase subunit 2 (subunit N)